MANQKYSDQDVLSAFHAANKNLTQAAKLIGASRQTVANTLVRLGVWSALPKKNKRVQIDKDVLFDLYHNKRMSTAEIATQFDVSAEGVRELMVRLSIPRRIASSCPGDKNPAWKGGRTIDKDGYVLVHAPGHLNSTKTGRIREHRLVMSEKLGRPLLRNEVVHHIDGDKQNNSLDNLELFDENSEHLRHELTGKVPAWTEAGLEAMKSASLLGSLNSLKTAWTDERREKARQRTIERHAKGDFGPQTWTEESRRLASEFAKSRNLPRLQDGTFAPQTQNDQGLEGE